MFLRITVVGLLFGVTSRVCAQEAFSDALPPSSDAKPGQATLESAWLDLRQNTSPNSGTQNAPAWVEAVTLLPAQSTGGSKSVFRIRVTPPSTNYQVLFFRLFFYYNPGHQPEFVPGGESAPPDLRPGP